MQTDTRDYLYYLFISTLIESEQNSTTDNQTIASNGLSVQMQQPTGNDGYIFQNNFKFIFV
jgi:hypothetical protein